jgi:hypothetical protein
MFPGVLHSTGAKTVETLFRLRKRLCCLPTFGDAIVESHQKFRFLIMLLDNLTASPGPAFQADLPRRFQERLFVNCLQWR